MELNQLRYVLESAQQENMTKAAENLHISQPSLSIQIKNLEDELGISLFERTRKRIYLTEAGKVFVHQAKQILQSIDSLSETMGEFASQKRGSIRIGLLPIMIHLGMDEMVSDFAEEHPYYSLKITEQGSQSLINSVLNNDLDAALAILTNANYDDRLHYIKLMESSIVAVVPAQHPLAKKESLVFDDFAGTKLVLTNGNFNMQRLILDELDKRNIQYDMFSQCNQIETCFSLASKGFGIAFCTEQTAKYYHFGNLVYIPILGITKRAIYLIYTKTPEYHPVLNSFINFATEYYL